MKLYFFSFLENEGVGDFSSQINPIKPRPTNDPNSHFFAYLLTLMIMTIICYLIFHNKKRVSLLLQVKSKIFY